VANPSTPAQYFHLLRDQALRRPATPLVVMTPKALLRHRACVSARREFAAGGVCPALDDPRSPEPGAVRRLLLCSGKVFYDLDAERERSAPTDLALCRLERLHPFPQAELRQLLAHYAWAREVVWVQEEPRNMGAWGAVRDALQEELRDTRRLLYVGRSPAASPATGSQRRHVAEQEALLREALHGARTGVPA
jgi:2-oxoglutarate dehydrogenase E1 component